MKKLNSLLISYFLFTLLLSSMAQASFIASNRTKLNPSNPTHLLIAGHPDNLGELFIYSLITRAKIYRNISPNEQIIIIGRNEDKDLIKEAGFNIIKTKIGMLKSSTIKEGIKDLNHIRSIDIYAHSNPVSGVTLDSNTWVYPLLNEKDDLWDEIKEKISDESYIFIHGCNAGIKMGPSLALKLQIAVFAALTSTDFQKPYYFSTSTNESNIQNLFWSFDYNIKKPNDINVQKSLLTCGRYCTRMKPDNSSYKGHWGDWSAGGYPAYKLFCGSNNNEKCEKGALEGIFTFPSLNSTIDATYSYSQIKTNLDIFKKILIDFMCPFSHQNEKQEECRLKLENNKENPFYSPFKGRTLVCDRIICKAHFNCSAINSAFSPGDCALENDSNEIEQSSTFVDEYNYFINTYLKTTNF